MTDLLRDIEGLRDKWEVNLHSRYYSKALGIILTTLKDELLNAQREAFVRGWNCGEREAGNGDRIDGSLDVEDEAMIRYPGVTK